MSGAIITIVMWIVLFILYFGEYYFFLFLLALMLGGAFAAFIGKN